MPVPARIPAPRRQVLVQRYEALRARQAALERLIADHNRRCADETPSAAPISPCEAERAHIDYLVAEWRRDAKSYNADVRAAGEALTKPR